MDTNLPKPDGSTIVEQEKVVADGKSERESSGK
jgi:hypothetical protein